MHGPVVVIVVLVRNRVIRLGLIEHREVCVSRIGVVEEAVLVIGIEASADTCGLLGRRISPPEGKFSLVLWWFANRWIAIYYIQVFLINISSVSALSLELTDSIALAEWADSGAPALSDSRLALAVAHRGRFYTAGAHSGCRRGGDDGGDTSWDTCAVTPPSSAPLLAACSYRRRRSISAASRAAHRTESSPPPPLAAQWLDYDDVLCVVCAYTAWGRWTWSHF